MSKRVILRVIAGTALLGAPLTAGFAQTWIPGSEIAGHSVQVETNGVMNTVYFEPGGTARIQTAGGNMVQANWSVSGNQLCLNASGAQECWAYNTAFQAGQQVTMTSTCGTSRWLPLSTAQPPMQTPMGERG